MKIKLTFLLVFVGFLFGNAEVNAQNAYDSPYLNRAILKYYSGNELTAFKFQDSVKYEQIKYYFTQSFIVEKVGCLLCKPDYNTFFNVDLFNVVEFERLRDEVNTVPFSFKDSQYQITLLSRQTIETEMGVSFDAVLNFKVFREIPEWVETGNGVLDYTNYKSEVEKWAKDFPLQYKEITSTTTILKIPVGEFLSYSQSRKNAVLSHLDGYIIID